MANLPKLYVVVNCLPNEFVNTYVLIFTNGIFHFLMYKYIHNQLQTQKYMKYPKHAPMNQFSNLLTITYKSLPNWQNI